jgi:hypothetical protein
MKKRKRWIIVGVFVVAVAAVAAGAYLWLGRDDSATVHYMTAEVATGTISQTVEADFTLSSENGTMSIALGGGAATDSTASSAASDSTSTSTSSLENGATLASGVPAVYAGGGDLTAAAATTFVAYTSARADARAASSHSVGDLPDASDDSGSPTASPTATVTPSPTPTPTPTRTKTPVPSPSPSRSGFPSGGGSGGSAGGSSSAATTTGSTGTGTSSGTSSVSGVVTRLVQPAGATPITLQRLLYVSGKPVFAFVSPTPLWKNLSTSLPSGAQRVNVVVLQKALKKQGYYKKAIIGNFTAATKKALKRWQKANGLGATGVVDVTRFVWMPTGSVLTAWSVNLGSHVSSGSALASVVSPSRLSAEALISQADIADLKVGQEAQMAIDGYDDDAFAGRITYISDEPASSSSGSGSSGSTQYSITVTAEDLPEMARSGMTGALDIVIEQVSDVLIVPTTAVSGSSSTSFVRILQDGQPVFRQVQTGMATSSYTEIVSGLAEGETVVTGQYTEGADSVGTSSSQTQRQGGGIFQGGGGMQIPPSGGMPGGGMPSGGGQ